MADSMNAAIQGWGEDMPDDIRRLAEECDLRGSQKSVGEALGYKGGATTNQVLHNNYNGDIDGVRDRIRAVFMSATVDCPVAGPKFARASCLTEQSRTDIAIPLHTRFRRACPFCRHCRRRRTP